MTSPAPAPLLANRDFRRLWAAQGISVFGSTVAREALPLAAVLTLAASPAQVGLLGALAALPALLFGLPAGVWLDRMRRRPVLIAADLGRAALLSAIPLAALWGRLDMGLLYAVAFGVGTLSLLFGIADNAYLPALVGRRHLLEANSRFGSTDALAEIGAPALGGILVQTLGAPVAIALDALSYLGSALFLGQIRRPEPQQAPPEALDDGARRAALARFRAELGEGLRAIGGSPTLRALAGSSATRSFFGSFLGALYALYALRALGLSPGALGLLVGLGGLSALAGSLLAGRATRRLGVGPALLWTGLLSAALTALIPLAGVAGPPALLLGLGQLLGDGLLVLHMIASLSLRQAVTPERLLGRVNGAMDVLTTGLAPLGLLAGGWLGQTVGLRPTLALATAGMLASLLWLLASPVARMRTMPESAEG